MLLAAAALTHIHTYVQAIAVGRGLCLQQGVVVRTACGRPSRRVPYYVQSRGSCHHTLACWPRAPCPPCCAAACCAVACCAVLTLQSPNHKVNTPPVRVSLLSFCSVLSLAVAGCGVLCCAVLTLQLPDHKVHHIGQARAACDKRTSAGISLRVTDKLVAPVVIVAHNRVHYLAKCLMTLLR